MPENNPFHSVEFFRNIRDGHARTLAGKSTEEIIAFFNEGASFMEKPGFQGLDEWGEWLSPQPRSVVENSEDQSG